MNKVVKSKLKKYRNKVFEIIKYNRFGGMFIYHGKDIQIVEILDRYIVRCINYDRLRKRSIRKLIKR